MMNYIDINKIEKVMVDFSSYCNAMCLRCGRNYDGKVINEYLPLQHMTKEIFEKFFVDDIFESLKYVEYNGNYGDPCMNNYLLESLNFLLSKKNIRISIHTNGGMNTKNFWEELAKISKNSDNCNVIFAIDGLEDTNHIYRKNVRWKKLMNNVKTFIDNGGKAEWQFIPFKHNNHQIEHARKMSVDMGFVEFYTLQDYGIYANDEISDYLHGKNLEYADDDVNRDIIDNEVSDEYDDVIECQWRNDKSILLQFNGDVWPCCFIPQGMFSKEYDDNNSYINLIKMYGNNFNSLHYNSIFDILNNKWYNYDLVNSFSNNCLEKCSDYCTVKKLKIKKIIDDVYR